MSIFEQDVVVGTFTHRTTYLPRLLESVKKFMPNAPFIVQIADLPINENFEALREKFKATNKRFWLFLDDDIEFMHPETLSKAVETLIRGKYAMVGAYSTFDPCYQINPEELIEKEIPWMPGYFQLVDSHLVGDVGADLSLPDPNTSIDTSYCITIKALGHKIGMAPVVVYHAYKKYSWCKQDVVQITNEYLMEKYGQFYFDNCHGYFNIVGGYPANSVDVRSGTISIDDAELIRNRELLRAWQGEWYYRNEEGKVKLNLGAGSTRYPGYLSCDIQGDQDIVCDLRILPFEDNSVDEITCHHALEHIPYREFLPTLREWFRVLKPGGYLDLGMPDLELLCKNFLLMDEERRWKWVVYTIYGQQGTTDMLPHLLTEDDPIDHGQIHRGGVSLERMRQYLLDTGFEIINLFNYDGFDTPSIFAFVTKPVKGE